MGLTIDARRQLHGSPARRAQVASQADAAEVVGREERAAAAVEQLAARSAHARPDRRRTSDGSALARTARSTSGAHDEGDDVGRD